MVRCRTRGSTVFLKIIKHFQIQRHLETTLLWVLFTAKEQLINYLDFHRLDRRMGTSLTRSLQCHFHCCNAIIPIAIHIDRKIHQFRWHIYLWYRSDMLNYLLCSAHAIYNLDTIIFVSPSRYSKN